jgi:hypothetical protein
MKRILLLSMLAIGILTAGSVPTKFSSAAEARTAVAFPLMLGVGY